MKAYKGFNKDMTCRGFQYKEGGEYETDMAKLREALEYADKELRLATEDDRYGDDLVYLVGCMRTVAEVCRAALAAPARNCDVGTAEEQSARFDGFCHSNLTYEKGCSGCPLNGIPCCELAWAQMPYEEGDAK